MSQNPLNLAVRFALELAGLYALGLWGWTQHTGILRYLLTIGLPNSMGNLPRTCRFERERQSACPGSRLAAFTA